MKMTEEKVEGIVKEIASRMREKFDWFLTGSCAYTGFLREGGDVDIVINKKILMHSFKDILISDTSRLPKGYIRDTDFDYLLYANINGFKVNIIIAEGAAFDNWRKATQVCVELNKLVPNFMEDKSMRVMIFEIIIGAEEVELIEGVNEKCGCDIRVSR